MDKVNKLKVNGQLFKNTLQQLSDPPHELFVRGDIGSLLSMPRLGVVGSRKATPYGRAVTEKLVSGLSRRGVVIVSGLALGIDSIAHTACVNVKGRTIAVLPCGLDRVYPSSHTHLARQILETGGAIVSEYPEETEPFKTNFIARNRIIAALSDVLLIPEAAAKSGSLHTANFALDLGKPVLAVPGNITSAMSEGTNNLIKAGATPVTETKDIYEALGLSETSEQLTILAESAEEAVILELLQSGVSAVEELQAHSQLDPAVFNQTLTMMEISGKVTSLGGGHWRLN